MDAHWYKETVEEAIRLHGKPEILKPIRAVNLPQRYLLIMKLTQDIKLSMEGKGKAIDNVFIERLWRSVKYANIYLNPPESGIGLYRQLK